MSRTITASKRSTAITTESIERTQAQVEHAIATAFEPEEVLKAYDMAAACKLLARQVDASKAVQNRCAASHTKAVRKVGELTQRMRNEGVLAKNGGTGRRNRITGDDSESSESRPMKLIDLGINPNIAAAGIKLLSLTPEQIDEKSDAATKSGVDFSCRKLVTDLSRASKESKREDRRKKNREKVAGVCSVETLESLDGVKFATIVIDPPWDWGDEGDQDQLGRARPDYSTMTENVYGFDQQLIASRGIVTLCDVGSVLAQKLPGCVSACQADAEMDRTGVDWIATLRSGRTVGVDLKRRGKDPLQYGHDDLALETWSVLDQKVGWTRDPSKACEWILWLWNDTGRFCLVPFPALCGVFDANWRDWLAKYGRQRQKTQRGSSSWISECVFVPRPVVWNEIVEWCGGVL